MNFSGGLVPHCDRSPSSAPSATALKAQARGERWRRLGLNVDMSELVYHGDRNHVIDYLAAHGWRVTSSGTPELFAANGFALADGDEGAAMADVKYLTATFQGA